jgi:HAMP domain-containing protein
MPRGLQSRFHSLSLGAKFTLILVLVFLLGTVVGGVTLYQGANQRAEDEVTLVGETLLETMNSVRSYTSGHVRPLLADDLQTQPDFISETVPAFSARTVFETVRTDEAYENFLYKEATLNPSNRDLDLADAFEADLVAQFRADDGLLEVTGFRDDDGQGLFYIARPMRITNESCLECHGDPADAPASMINTYGSENGFGWQMNEIVAAQIIYVPASDVINNARLLFGIVLGIFVVIFIAAIVLLNRLLKPTVLQPIQHMAQLADMIRNDQMDDKVFHPEFLADVASRGDELGHLAKVFQGMATEVRARESKLKQEVIKLQVEIDESRKTADLKEITESEYFKDLQKQARELRKGNQQRPKPGTSEA